MAFRKALILGGAVLLVAACSNLATSPTASMDGADASAVRATPRSPTPTTTTLSGDSTGTCRGGYSHQSGRDSTCIGQ